MANKSRGKVRKARHRESDRKKYNGAMNRQWVSDDGTVVIGFKFCL